MSILQETHNVYKLIMFILNILLSFFFIFMDTDSKDIETSDIKSDISSAVLTDLIRQDLPNKHLEALDAMINKDDTFSNFSANTDDPSKDFRKLPKRIKNELMYPAYYTDIQDLLKWRFKWRRYSNLSENLSKVLAGVSTILSFAAGFFSQPLLSFAAGCSGTGALVLNQYSSYAMGESKERTLSLNTILVSLGIAGVPEIEDIKEEKSS